MLTETTIVFLPGQHSSELTDSLLNGFEFNSYLVCAAFPSFSSKEQVNFIQKHRAILERNIVIVAFSAGAVGAAETASTIEKWGYNIKSIIMIDAWGVPLYGNFDKYRLSHDLFTHWSSHLLGGGDYSFYADPAVSHLQMWQSSQVVPGYLLEQVSQGCYKYSKTDLIKALTYFIKNCQGTLIC